MKMQHPLVIGLGITGLSVVDFYARHGISVLAVDDKKDESELPSVRFLTTKQVLEQMEMVGEVIVSPGVPPTHPVVAACRSAGRHIIGDIELAFRILKERVSYPPEATILQKKQFYAGITGSNGKTTTTALASHMLSTCGVRNQAVGNVGTPILSTPTFMSPYASIPERAGDLSYVIELSSYQIDTTYTPILDVGVILNITPNHLDRYGSMDIYARSKCNIQRLLCKGMPLYVGASFPEKYLSYLECPPVRTLYLKNRDIVWEEQVVGALPEQLGDIRTHHTENFLAALFIALQAGCPPIAAIDAYKSFKAPPHRIEFIRCYNGVSFWDDSKATSIDAVCKAITSIPGKIILLAGGVHKGEPYTAWGAFKEKIEGIITFGEAAPLIREDLAHHIQIVEVKTLQDAVHAGLKMAKSGMHVLLSPGCASYDMFKDYKDRGEQFQAVVKGL